MKNELLANSTTSKDENLEEDELTEEDFDQMSNEELLLYAADSLSCFVDKRWQDSNGNKSWHLMLLEAINERNANILIHKGLGK